MFECYFVRLNVTMCVLITLILINIQQIQNNLTVLVVKRNCRSLGNYEYVAKYKPAAIIAANGLCENI